ncbi:MFS transporter [Saccharomonospora marina]|nr:MFS transporter [Saccharomonospora marina]
MALLGQMTRRQQAIMAASVISNGMMFATLSSVSVALPEIQREFDVSRSAVNWVIAGALLPLASLVLIGGRLGDLFGRRRMFLVSVTGFGLASALCGLAPGETLLVAGRVGQGLMIAIGAPLALANVTEAFDEDSKGWAIGVLSAGITLATLSAPLGMAAVVQLTSWRWLFLPIAPVCALLVLLAWRYMVETRVPRAKSLDLRGLVLLAAGLTMLAVGSEQAGYWGFDWRTFTLLSAGVATLVAFGFAERRAKAPLLRVDLLRKRAVTGSVVCLAAMQWAAIGFSVYLMLYAQQVLELDPLAAGLLLLASGIGPPLFSSLAGWLTDRGMAAWLVVGGLAVAAVTLIFTASGVQRYQDVLLIPLFFAFGTAAAFVYTPSSASTMIAAPEAEEGVVAGLTMEARQIGSVVGITATSAVLVAVEWRMRDALLLGPDAYFSVEQRHALDGLLSDSETGARLLNSLPPGQRPDVVEAAKEAYVTGLETALLVNAGLLALVAILGFMLLRPVRRRVEPPALEDLELPLRLRVSELRPPRYRPASQPPSW